MIRLAIAATVLCLITTLVGIGGAAAPDILPVAGRNVVKPPLSTSAYGFRARTASGVIV